MSGPAEIQRARTAARLARLRLAEDAGILRDRLNPGNALADVRARAVDAAGDLRDRAVEAARRRPVAIAGGIAAVGLLAAFGPVRRAARTLGGALWRNRAAIGRFIDAKRLARKDPTP